MNLEVNDLLFTYRSTGMLPQNVFSGISLGFASGRCTAVIGDEGTGKSTLLQILSGLLKPDSGSVLIDGADPSLVRGGWRSMRRRMAVAFQFPEQQFLCETVLDELLYTCRGFHIPLADERGLASEALLRLQLDAALLERSPFSLSMGEARRVAIASLLLHQPEVLLLDEPTAGLDEDAARPVFELLTRLKANKRTIILATHDHSAISTIADGVVLMGENPRSYSIEQYLSDLSRDFIY